MKNKENIKFWNQTMELFDLTVYYKEKSQHSKKIKKSEVRYLFFTLISSLSLLSCSFYLERSLEVSNVFVFLTIFFIIPLFGNKHKETSIFKNLFFYKYPLNFISVIGFSPLLFFSTESSASWFYFLLHFKIPLVIFIVFSVVAMAVVFIFMLFNLFFNEPFEINEEFEQKKIPNLVKEIKIQKEIIKNDYDAMKELSTIQFDGEFQKNIFNGLLKEFKKDSEVFKPKTEIEQIIENRFLSLEIKNL